MAAISQIRAEATKRTDRADDQRHGGQQQHAAVGAKIRQFIFPGCGGAGRFAAKTEGITG